MTAPAISRAISPAGYATAQQAGRAAASSEFRALAVSYLPARDALEVITVNNGGFIIPRHLIKPLQHATPSDLAKMQLWPDGSLLEIEHLDSHISIDGMIKAALPALVPGRIMASLFASAGGATRSPAKAASSRANGKRGGRPKTASTTP